MLRLSSACKKTGFIALCVILMSSAIPNNIAFSSTLNDLQSEKQEVDQEMNILTNEILEKEAQLDQSEQEINSIHIEIQSLTQRLTAILSDVESVTASINRTAQELEELHTSILMIEKRLHERDNILRNRIRTLQTKDRFGDFIDMLLSAESLADLIGRYSASVTLLKADRQIIEQQQEDYEQLDELKTIVSEKLKEQRINNKELQQSKSTLEFQQNETNSKLDDLQSDKHTLLNEKADIESRYEEARQRSDELAQEILAIENRQVSYSQEYTDTLSSPPSVNSLPASCTATGTVNADTYFNRFQNLGVLSGKGQMFIDIAKEYNIDPVLMAAISFHETGYGSSNAIVNYNNPGGLMNPATNWSTLIRFDSLEAGLRSTAKTINKLVYKGGLSTISDLGAVYAPLGAANDPTGLNSHWQPTVTKLVNELGGLTTNCD